MDKVAVKKIQKEILEAALPNVAFDGWSMKVLESAAKVSGYEPSMVNAVFPRGLIEVLEYFSTYIDALLISELANIDQKDMRVRERIAVGVMARFEILNSYKEALRQSVRFWSLPTRKPRAVKMVWRTADKIWNWAGDTAKDYNHYTKRALLSGVIVSSTLVWLDDDTPNIEVTRGFLQRRINNVLVFGRWMGKISFLKKTGETE